MNCLEMGGFDLYDQRVLMREDLNVPLKNGGVADDSRIQAAVPGVKHALERGGKVMILSHLGRPEEGRFDPACSLAPVAARLSELLGEKVELTRDWLNGVKAEKGKALLLENVRFLKGEKKNDPELGRKMASLCDLFVMDAFGAAHRAHASTEAVARFSPRACAGPLLVRELNTLSRALENPARPVTAIVGGSKVSTKLTVLKALLEKVDKLIIGGGIANTFLAASGVDVGVSLHEPSLMAEAKELIRQARERGCEIPLPTDVVCSPELSERAEGVVRKVENIRSNEMVLDIGPDTAGRYAEMLGSSGTIVWNGPVGAFEFSPFSLGTKQVAEAVAESPAFSVAGGGDTLAALSMFGLSDRMSYRSTGGGAFLEFLEGKTLPAVAVLHERAG